MFDSLRKYSFIGHSVAFMMQIFWVLFVLMLKAFSHLVRVDLLVDFKDCTIRISDIGKQLRDHTFGFHLKIDIRKRRVKD